MAIDATALRAAMASGVVDLRSLESQLAQLNGAIGQIHSTVGSLVRSGEDAVDALGAANDNTDPPDPTPTPTPTPVPVAPPQPIVPATLAFRSTWEKDWQTEGWYAEYTNGFQVNAAAESAQTLGWRVASKAEFPQIQYGDKCYRGWIRAAATGRAHRAYPVLHTAIPSPLICTFHTFIRADFSKMTDDQWVQISTLGTDDAWSKLFTLSIVGRPDAAGKRGRLLMYHTVAQAYGPIFPVEKWVRVTIYASFVTGDVRVWLDGVPAMKGKYPYLEDRNLRRAHWGMYAHPGISEFEMWQDEIAIWSLPAEYQQSDVEPVK